MPFWRGKFQKNSAPCLKVKFFDTSRKLRILILLFLLYHKLYQKSSLYTVYRRNLLPQAKKCKFNLMIFQFVNECREQWPFNYTTTILPIAESCTVRLKIRNIRKLRNRIFRKCHFEDPTSPRLRMPVKFAKKFGWKNFCQIFDKLLFRVI